MEQEPDSTTKATPKAEAWTLTGFTTNKRKVSRREQQALDAQKVVAVDEVPLDPSLLVPMDLQTTRSDMLARIHFDVPRLLCIAKQYPRSCGVTSLTSVWNSLYSVIGHGTLPPVSQEEVMTILGFQPPFDVIRWGPFTGNVTLLRWFHTINRHKGVQGKAYIMWKAHGHGRTIGVDSGEAQRRLVEALQCPQAAVVYHCHNHYMVPIGYQWIPKRQSDCYRPGIKDEDCDMTVYIGEVSRGKHPAIHVKKWSDVAMDIETLLPSYVNIRRPEISILTRAKKSKPSEVTPNTETETATDDVDAVPPPAASSGVAAPAGGRSKVGNLHCLMCFCSDVVEEDIGQFMEDGELDDVDEELGDDAEN